MQRLHCLPQKLARISLCFITTLLILAGSVTTAQAQDNGAVRAVRVHATTQASPAQITLHWEASPHPVSHFYVHRRVADSNTWVYQGNDPVTTATSWVDTNVTPGVRYEYRVYRQYESTSSTAHARGYTIAGIDAPLLDQRGTVILVIDSTHQTALAAEIARFKNDLAGDGWTVIEETVAPSDTPPAVRAKLQTHYNADPANVKAAILLGRIPVPYSGDIMPDAHAEHHGAWPADTYYADLTGTWTDATVNRTTANQTRTHNVPGDGKFDQSHLPSDANIAIGRIDMANLSGFSAGANETELLRNYLRKNHEFRHRLGEFADIPRRGLIRDSFGFLSSEAPASVAWRGFTPLFGPANVHTTSNLLDTLETNKYLWAYGNGPGGYTSGSGIGTSTDFKTRDSLAVFNMMFGSYFGDWDSPTDNFLRAPLAGTPGSLTLVNTWGNRPDWNVHGMTLGETIGDAYLRTVNSPSDWSPNWTVGYFTYYTSHPRMVHVALMGDPTLRLHPVASPADGTVSRTSGGGGGPHARDTVDLTWQAVAEDGLIGYHVYRSASQFGPYTRLTSTPTDQLSYSDTDAPKSKVFYQVRAVVLTSSASGTYFNAGQAQLYSVPLAAPTSAPTDFTATAISDSAINLSWTSEDPDADFFIVERRVFGDTEWTELAELDGTLRQYQDTGLTASTSYEYRIFAVNSLGSSPASGIASATTLSSTVIVFDPFTDGGVTNGADPLDVNWSKTDTSPSNTNFVVVQDSILDPVAPHNVAELHINASNIERYLYFPLPNEVQLAVGESLRLSFKLRHTGTPRTDVSSTAFSLAHTPTNSPWSNENNKEYWVRTSYGSAGTLGTIRKSLALQVLNTGTVLQDGTASINAGTDVLNVAFEVTRTQTEEVRIRYQFNGGAWQETFDNTDVITAFNRVFFRFRTRNDAENPGEPRFRLDDVTVETVPAPPVPPASVSDLIVNPLSPSSLAVTWTAAPTATGYAIERSPTGTADSWTTLDANLPAEPTSFTDTDLASGTTYHYRVAAFNTHGTSDWVAASGTTGELEYALILPGSVSEDAGSFEASVTRTTSTGNQVVLLSTGSEGLTVPSSVTIPDGLTSVQFSVTVINGAIIGESDLATITAFAPTALVGEWFDGPVDSAVSGQSTGWGWGGAWIGVGASPVLVEPSLAYTQNGSIDTAGTGAAKLVNNGAGGSAYRAFNQKYTSGSVWISTLIYRNSTNWGTQLIVRDNPGSGAWGRVIYQNNTNHWALEASGATADPDPNLNPVQQLLASNPYPETFFVVMEFDFNVRKIRAWMNPDVSGGSPANALAIGEVDMQSTMGGVNRLDIFGHSNADQFDEIRVASSFADLYDGTTFNSQITIEAVVEPVVALNSESFNNATGGNISIADSAPGWQVHFSTTGELVTNTAFISNQPTAGASNTLSHPDAPDAGTNGVAYMYFGAANSTRAFLLWRELAEGIETVENLTFDWWNLHQNANAQSRLAVRINGQWYLHRTAFTSTQTGATADFSTKASPASVGFTFDAADWSAFAFAPGTAFAATNNPTALGAPLPAGVITDVGLYNYTVSEGSINGASVDAFTITGPESAVVPLAEATEVVAVAFESDAELNDAFRTNLGSASRLATSGLSGGGALATTGNPQLLYRTETFSPAAENALGVYVHIGEAANSGYDSVTTMLGLATKPTMHFQGGASDPNVFVASRVLNLSNNGGYRLEILNKAATDTAQSTVASGATFALTDGAWYYVRHVLTPTGGNAFTVLIEVYASDAAGTTGTLITSLSETLANAQVAADTRLWAMLRSRRDGNAAAMDNFAVSATTAAPAPLRTFVMSGQSNAVGYRSNDRNALPEPLRGPISGVHGAWFVGNKDGDTLVPYTSDGWGLLEVQNVGTTNGAFWPNAEGFGPEITLADRLHTHYAEDIAVVKFAVNGASLAVNFDQANGGTSGYYDDLRDYLRDRRTDLENSLDRELNWKGFFWLQGESDASGNSPQPATADAYAANLQNFIQTIRADLGASELMFVASHINPRSSGFTITRNTVINQAMLTVAGQLDNVRVSPATDLYPASGDDLHFNSVQTQTIGHRMADAFLKTPATVTLGDLLQSADGTPRAISATTAPSGLSVVLTYDAASTAPTEEGSYPVLGIINDAVYSGFAIGTLTIEAALSAIETWQTDYFTEEELNDPELESTLWGPNADPDGDGVPNLLEFALGGDPLLPGTATLPVMGSTVIDEVAYLTLTIVKNAAASDLNFVVETSTELSAWLTGEGNIVVLSETETELVVRTAAPVSGYSRRFMRLRVIAP